MGTNTTSFYLDPPQLIGRPNSDGTVTLTPLELKKLNDFNYAVSKMLQGGLNLANLNTETNQVFTDMDGNITTVSATADGLAADISNIEGNITSLSATTNGLVVDVQNLENRNTVSITSSGLYVTDKYGNSTQLTGNHIKSGTLEGVTLLSTGSYAVRVYNGRVEFGYYTGGTFLTRYYLEWDGSRFEIYANGAYPMKLQAGAAVSIDAAGSNTIWIGTSNSYETIKIGDQSGGTSSIYLTGNVYINGVLQ